MATAPAKAPTMTDMLLPKWSPVPISPLAPMALPMESMTMATPNDAPLEMPNTEGPARGLWKNVCNISPEAAREAPHRMAVRA